MSNEKRTIVVSEQLRYGSNFSVGMQQNEVQKWPYRKLCKLDKEIVAIEQQSSSIEISNAENSYLEKELELLKRRRDLELDPVKIPLPIRSHTMTKNVEQTKPFNFLGEKLYFH